MKKKLIINGQVKECELLQKRGGEDELELEIVFNGKKYFFKKKHELREHLVMESSRGANGKIGVDHIEVYSSGKDFIIDGKNYEIMPPEKTRSGGRQKGAIGEGNMLSPMPGKILKILVEVQDTVLKDDPLIVMEAMKMEHTVRANRDGKVTAIYFTEGDLVGGETELLLLSGKKDV